MNKFIHDSSEDLRKKCTVAFMKIQLVKKKKMFSRDCINLLIRRLTNVNLHSSASNSIICIIIQFTLLSFVLIT